MNILLFVASWSMGEWCAQVMVMSQSNALTIYPIGQRPMSALWRWLDGSYSHRLTCVMTGVHYVKSCGALRPRYSHFLQYDFASTRVSCTVGYYLMSVGFRWCGLSWWRGPHGLRTMCMLMEMPWLARPILLASRAVPLATLSISCTLQFALSN
jgi:hypothetical protein